MNFKIFNSIKEVKAWEESLDSRHYKDCHNPYHKIRCHSDFPIIVDLNCFIYETNNNGRDTEYYVGMSIKQIMDFLKEENFDLTKFD